MRYHIAALFVLPLVITGCSRRAAENDAVAVAAAGKTIEAKAGGTLVFIPAGEFMMGDATSDRPDEKPPHQVSVSSFYLDTTPVTQEVYEKVMGVNPSKRKAKSNPVERSQWTDAVRFCNKCSELENLTPCYDQNTWECNFAADGYRLPTEAEWEYACRAGSATKYICGDADTELAGYAWFKPHSQGKTQPVGQKKPNAWGLFDMNGNVWQWCNDWHAENSYAASPKKDPRGPASGKQRVLRGGAWDCTAEKLRSAYRNKEFPTYSDACFGADSYGFRRARSLVEKPTAVAANPKAFPVADPTKKGESAPAAAPAQGTGKIDVAKLKGTIVFVSDRSGVLKIWTMHASGKNARQLTKGNDADADPRFSPDGKRIMYTTLKGGFPEIWMMNRDGSEPKSITKGSQATWAPDGKSIIFINDNQTFVRDLATGKERLVTPKAWERCGVPAISPDGKRFAVASRHLGNIGIFILDLDGKESAALKTEEACCTPQWSKDGKRIICQTVQGHIHQVGVDGKNWEQLTFGADLQHDARYSPDGTMILFCRAPAAEGPWQICLKKLDDDEDFVQITKEGSNLLPDWHPDD
jgi:formylglycine-generating enzyme required for sulfatase activity